MNMASAVDAVSLTQGACVFPFERGGGLCKVCRMLPEVTIGRRCNRLVALSKPMQELLTKAATVAHTDASVVLCGESGSGKEVVARALHANSARRHKAFVAINCAALPAALLESELFGHARGAFTGATTARHGLFEAADGGTLLLDEVAEMPLALQAKLLRALQDGEVRRVGETEPIHVDVRILCATHQNLQQAVKERTFREDLYYRLKVFTLQVPPLRKRKEDIPTLAAMFLQKEQHPGTFSARALALLLKYPWPGNVRELANAVQHGAVLSRGKDVEVEHLPEELSQPVVLLDDAGPMLTLAEAERRHIVRVLEACGGQQLDAARVLAIGRTTLWRKLKEYGLDSA
jgi:DNA-binding NtrC family response regulator